MAPGLPASGDHLKPAPIILTDTYDEQAMSKLIKKDIDSPLQSFCFGRDKSGMNQEEKLPVPSKAHCKFKRQIKQFEKLESLVRQHSSKQPQPPLADDSEDKPTFFFGAFARAQLVDPIDGDAHFEDISPKIVELTASQVQDSNEKFKIASLLLQ